MGQCLGLGFWSFEGQEFLFFFFFCSDLFIFYKENAIIRRTVLCDQFLLMLCVFMFNTLISRLKPKKLRKTLSYQWTLHIKILHFRSTMIYDTKLSPQLNYSFNIVSSQDIFKLSKSNSLLMRKYQH